MTIILKVVSILSSKINYKINLDRIKYLIYYADIHQSMKGNMMSTTVEVFKEMLNKTMVSVEVSSNDSQLSFKDTEGTVYLFEHVRDCCESVYIESIVGDLNDLIGSPILRAESVSNSNTKKYPEDESTEWTFYKFATRNGYVDVRWLGESNGYYSMGVDFFIR